jgi:hypothetical protein
VFGNIKSNHHFKRFMLRGIQKVNIKTGLLALAQPKKKSEMQHGTGSLKREITGKKARKLIVDTCKDVRLS